MLASNIFILVSTPEKEAQLVQASKDGNLDRIRELLNQGTDIEAVDSEFQGTALWWAGKSINGWILLHIRFCSDRHHIHIRFFNLIP